LARTIVPLTLEQLAKLALADKRGRNGKGHEPLTTNFEDIQEFLRRAQAAGVQTQPEAPVLVGADLMSRVQPGPRMGELLKKAYQLQLERGITDKAVLLELILKDEV
jgi:hypothetical protein